MNPNKTAIQFLLGLASPKGVSVTIRICEMPVVDIAGIVHSIDSKFILVHDKRAADGAAPLRFTAQGNGVDISAAIVDVIPPEMSRAQAKELALSLLGKEPVRTIAVKTGLTCSTIANYCVERGIAPDYTDLFVHNGPHQSHWEDTKDSLKFATVQDAKDSVARFIALSDKYAAAGDRDGGHRVLEIALIGRNRALASNKREQAALFAAYIAGEMAKTGILPCGPTPTK